jgi:HIRAN domain
MIAPSAAVTRERAVRSLRSVEGATVRVHVEYDERYWYPDDGGQVWLAGYFPIESSSGRYLARDAPELAERGLRVVGVAGARQHHAAAVATDAAGPGRGLELRRDLANPHDVNAIAVHGAGGGEQLGWVPREVAAELAPELDEGRPWSAVVLREQRRSPRDPRHGLTMLLAPAASVELEVRGSHEAG